MQQRARYLQSEVSRSWRSPRSTQSTSILDTIILSCIILSCVSTAGKSTNARSLRIEGQLEGLYQGSHLSGFVYRLPTLQHDSTIKQDVGDAVFPSARERLDLILLDG